MKIYALNGGPRKHWNTYRMLEAFLDGAKSTGEDVQTELVNLFDLEYKGCHSCFACKRKGGASYGRCGYPDGIRELLAQVSAADGIVCGSPIYFHDITAQLRGFLERLFFQYHSFEVGVKSLAPKPIHSAVIYTMNVTEAQMKAAGYLENLKTTEGYFPYTFGFQPELLYAYNTYEFTDYSRYEAGIWDEAEKSRWHEEQFPKDLQAAFDAGKRMAESIRLEQRVTMA